MQEILNFRIQLFKDFKTGKISAETFANRSSNYFNQYKIKYVKMAHDLPSVVLNYLFWTAKIERKIFLEHEIARLNPALSDEIKLEQGLSIYRKRRNQMFRRLLYEFENQVQIESASIIVDDIVEIKLKEFQQPFYCNKEVLDRLKMGSELNYGTSIQPFYLPFVVYKINQK